MKMKLQLNKAGRSVIETAHDVADAESFGRACTALWMLLEQRSLGKATSVGDFMERAGENVARELDGAELRFSRD
jgi:hypothetical protein